MNKLMKKALALLLCAVMVLCPVAVFADEAELGSQENPLIVPSSDIRGLRCYVEPGQTKWVKADISSSTVTVGYATTPDYKINYNGREFFPETESGENKLYFGISDKDIAFSVVNTGDEGVLVCMTVAAGEYVDPTGSVDVPEVVTLEEDPRSGRIMAIRNNELAANNEGYHYKVVAPADGTIGVTVSAYDAEYNTVGTVSTVSNVTTSNYGENVYNVEEPTTTNISVSKGDIVIIMAATYSEATPFSAPAGTLTVIIGFEGVGTMNNPETAYVGDYEVFLEDGNSGYYYQWKAEAEGTVTVTVDGDAWQYTVNVAHTDETYIYGDTHWSDDDPVVASESHEVEAGAVVTIFVATYDPAVFWANPEGTVNLSITFKEKSAALAGDVDGDEEVTTKDVLAIRKHLASITELDASTLAVADVDCDGEVTTKDVLAIRKYLAGIITELPVA